MVTVRSRQQWGAAPPRDRPTRISRPVRELWLHHTVTNRYGDGGMRQLQQIAFGRGFDDISYSWVYDPRNRVFYVGRGPGVQGAHTAGRNSFSHAVSLIGNFQRDRLSDGNLDDLAAFCRLHEARGWGPGQFTGGHRDTKATACPGDHAYAAIGEINRRARNTTPPEPTKDWFDMATKADLRDVVRDELNRDHGEVKGLIRDAVYGLMLDDGADGERFRGRLARHIWEYGLPPWPFGGGRTEAWRVVARRSNAVLGAINLLLDKAGVDYRIPAYADPDSPGPAQPVGNAGE